MATRITSKTAAERALDVLPKISLVVGGVSLCSMTLLVASGVIARRVFNIGIPFAIEYAEYLMPIMVAWGAVAVMAENSHVNVDIVVKRFSKNAQNWTFLVGYIIGLCYLILLTRTLYATAAMNVALGTISLYPTRTQFGYVQYVMAAGLTLFCLQLVIEIIKKAVTIYLSHVNKAGGTKT